MKTLLNLVLLLVLAAALLTLEQRAGDAPELRTVTVAGLLLLGAWLTGRLFASIGLPRISGYLLIGMALGPGAWDLMSGAELPGWMTMAWHSAAPLVSMDEIHRLRFAGDLTVSLIALSAGAEIKLSFLRQQFRRMAVLLGIDTVFTLAVMSGLLLLFRGWIPFMAGRGWTECGVIAGVGAVVLISNSPTVLIAMVGEMRASGPMTQMLLSLAVCKDLILIVLFAVALSVGEGVLSGGSGLTPGFLLTVLGELLGSTVVGALLGAVMAWMIRRVDRQMILFVVGWCLLIAMLGEQHWQVGGQEVHGDPLLMALAAGMAIENLWPESGRKMMAAIGWVSLPVYCLFFTLAGADIRLKELVSLASLALAVVAVRSVTVWAGMRIGIKLSGLKESWAGLIWLGLIPQSGVSLVLLELMSRTFASKGWGPGLAALLMGAIVVHELLGPIGLRHAILTAGESGSQRRGEQAGVNASL